MGSKLDVEQNKEKIIKLHVSIVDNIKFTKGSNSKFKFQFNKVIPEKCDVESQKICALLASEKDHYKKIGMHDVLYVATLAFKYTKNDTMRILLSDFIKLIELFVFNAVTLNSKDL